MFSTTPLHFHGLRYSNLLKMDRSVYDSPFSIQYFLCFIAFIFVYVCMCVRAHAWMGVYSYHACIGQRKFTEFIFLNPDDPGVEPNSSKFLASSFPSEPSVQPLYYPISNSSFITISASNPEGQMDDVDYKYWILNKHTN